MKTALRKLSAMEDWEVYGVVINGETKAFAQQAGISRSTAEKYQREPFSDEEPNSTGIESPLTKLKRDITAAYVLFGADRAQILVDAVRLHMARLKGYRESRLPSDRYEEVKRMRDLLNEMLANEQWDRLVDVGGEKERAA